MEIPTTIRPILTIARGNTRAWFYRILILAYTSITILTVRACTDAPGASPSPGAAQLGKPECLNPGASFEPANFQPHYVYFQDRDGHKLIPDRRSNHTHTRTHGISHTNSQWVNYKLLINSYIALQKCYDMDIIKQHVILSLIRSKRYELNPETGEIISNIGQQPRVIKPIVHYSGYLQYNLDIGFNRSITVYGQGFSYLAHWLTPYDPKFVIDHKDKDKSNNRPNNLQCITEKDNLQGTWKRGNKPGCTRVRLPIDIKEAIKADFASGISQVKLAKKYSTTRQTIAKIVNVT